MINYGSADRANSEAVRQLRRSSRTDDERPGTLYSVPSVYQALNHRTWSYHSLGSTFASKLQFVLVSCAWVALPQSYCIVSIQVEKVVRWDTGFRKHGVGLCTN